MPSPSASSLPCRLRSSARSALRSSASPPAHGAWLVGLLAVGNALLGMALGLLASAFARTEFQAVQFMPAIVFPQLLLCGLFVPRSAMAVPLQYVAYAFPLTYAFDALSRATHAGPLGGTFVLDVVVVIGATLGALALAAATLRRRRRRRPQARLGVYPDAERYGPRNSCGMTPATINALGMIVATVLMLLAGLSKKRLEWKPRDETRRGRKPPGTA